VLDCGCLSNDKLIIDGILVVHLVTTWHKRCSNGWQKSYFGWDSILSYSLSRQVCSLTFKAGVIEPMPLAFKASEMSAAPLVPYYISPVSQIWTGSWVRINPSYLSIHSLSTLWKKKDCILYTPTLFLCEMKLNKREMRVDKNDQWDAHAHPTTPSQVIDRWWTWPGISVHMKKFSPQTGIDPKLLAFKASLLNAFEASGIGPVPLAFKANVMSAAPVVLHCTSEDSQVWIESWMRVNPSYLSKHSTSTPEGTSIASYISLLCNCAI